MLSEKIHDHDGGAITSILIFQSCSFLFSLCVAAIQFKVNKQSL